MLTINVSSEYSKTPGGRYINEGSMSGEDFRKTKLYPMFEKALEEKQTLEINLDGTYGYATSFLEEAFGGLARQLKGQDIAPYIKIVSNDEPSLVDDIFSYISKAND